MSLFGGFCLAVTMFAVVLLTLAVLMDCWHRAVLEMSTKFALTQVYAVSWTLLFENGWLFLIGQAALALTLWSVTVRSLRRESRDGNHPKMVS